jgi:hypothetical protein
MCEGPQALHSRVSQRFLGGNGQKNLRGLTNADILPKTLSCWSSNSLCNPIASKFKAPRHFFHLDAHSQVELAPHGSSHARPSKRDVNGAELG